jgi:hypothetical protein
VVVLQKFVLSRRFFGGPETETSQAWQSSGEEMFYISLSLGRYRERICGEKFRYDFHSSIRKATKDEIHPNSCKFSLFLVLALLIKCGKASTYSLGRNCNEFEIDGASSSGLSRRRQHQPRISQDSDDDVWSSPRRKRPLGSFSPPEKLKMRTLQSRYPNSSSELMADNLNFEPLFSPVRIRQWHPRCSRPRVMIAGNTTPVEASHLRF